MNIVTGRSGEDLRIAPAAAAIRAACAQHGVEHATLASVAGASLEHATDYVFQVSDRLPTAGAMRRLAAEVERYLDLPEPLDVHLEGAGFHLLIAGRALLATCVFAVSIWIVVGGIATQQNDFAKTHSAAAAGLLLVIATVVLALLEAAHIGAVVLSTADVSSLAATHPRVVSVHRHIATKGLLEEYLAARQVGVVLVVFWVSEITRTADLTVLPWTEIAIPAALEPLLTIGVPGALLVLVIAQVMPQIITARRPAAMMNLLPMWLAFNFTRFIGIFGLARPASWLVRWAKPAGRIPSAPRERYESTTRDVDGHAVLSIQRAVFVEALGTRSTTATSVIFRDNDWTVLPCDIASTKVAPNGLMLEAGLVDDDTAIVTSQLVERPIGRGQGSVFASTFAPRIGGFAEGQTLSVTATMLYDQRLAEDVLVVTQPTKLVTVRVVVEHPPVPLATAVLEIRRLADDTVTMIKQLPVRVRKDGSVEIVATAYYPTPGSSLTLRWTAGDMTSLTGSHGTPMMKEVAR